MFGYGTTTLKNANNFLRSFCKSTLMLNVQNYKQNVGAMCSLYAKFKTLNAKLSFTLLSVKQQKNSFTSLFLLFN